MTKQTTAIIPATESDPAANDVQGFILPLVFGAAAVVGFAAGYFGTKGAIEDSGSGMTTGQMVQGWVDQANGARARLPK